MQLSAIFRCKTDDNVRMSAHAIFAVREKVPLRVSTALTVCMQLRGLNINRLSYPRIIAKDSSLEKYAAPGKAVTVSFPEIEKEIHTTLYYREVQI